MNIALLLVSTLLSIVTGDRVTPPDLPDNPDNERLTPWPAGTLDLSQIPYKIVHETYRQTDGRRNWEIFVMNADGSNPVNLTNTPETDEMYPHVSPDGKKICFVVDEGERRNRVRHVYVMDIDGSNRVHIADHAREPCWSFDGKSVAYLTDEYARFSTREYATDALMYYYLENKWVRPHVNTDLHHLYAICWSPDGKWFTAAVSGGMGYSDTIIAFEAFGQRVFDLAKWGVKGCRPDLSVEGNQMVWGETDWNLKIGDIAFGEVSSVKSEVSSEDRAPETSNLKLQTLTEPKVTNTREILRCSRNYKVYHVDLSPDQKWITFTYGPFRGGQQVGGFADGWNICVGNLQGQWVQITDNGLHNKEPDWIPIK
ncbi:MAG: PD40 domain-containing protein [Sedimentisphaerales bacterium]|nr:PD40 domain-containing protein [Sedimentisphaerales bacterium]